MRSHLTRRVFRRIILNQPVVRHRPLHIETRPQLHTRDHNHGCLIRHGQTRTFFGFFEKKQQGRDLRTPLLDPGMEKMLELDKRLHLVARLPPASELVRAFRAFVASKLKQRRPVEDFHATQLLQTLKMIEHPESVAQGNAQTSSGPESKLTKEDLDSIFEALIKSPKFSYTEQHNSLAKMAMDAWSSKEYQQASTTDMTQLEAFPVGYLRVLCATGDTMLARDTAGRHGINIDLFVLAGFAREDNEAEMLRTYHARSDQSIYTLRKQARIIATFYARKNDATKTKKWFTSELMRPYQTEKVSSKTDSSLISTNDMYETLLQFCLKNNEMPWGQSVIAAVKDDQAEVRTWDAVFLASAATGKSVDDIDRMINVMIRRADEAGQPGQRPGLHTLNGLIKSAISKNDPYTAERYFALFTKYRVEPNAATYILQIEYRLQAGDVDGAIGAYDSLRKQTISEDEDWDIMNKLLLTLVKHPSTPHDLIMGLVDDLSDRRKIFPAETVLGLCTYHLERDEYFFIVDLLQTYAYQYSIAQRLQIRDVLVKYTLDPATDTGRAWDTYMIFHQVFDQETQRDIREQVMTNFFVRKRPDLSTHVFTRMSRHMRSDTRPTAETYTRAFEGISRTSEPDALEIIHNLLKLDTEVEPNTKLSNSLMLAYAYCGMPSRALDFWEQIATSHEGPSYESLHIAFRACERAPFGYKEAIKIFTKLRQADIEITTRLFADYMGCLSGQGMFDLAKEGMRDMEKYTGFPCDFFTLASVFNACPGVVLQRRIEKECSEEFPKLWAEVLERGWDENQMGIKVIKGVDRSLKA